MTSVRRIRALLHRPYLRAVFAALALVTAAGAFATIALEMRFGVPPRAVLRYFGRLHSDAEDLSPLLRQPPTLAALARMSYASSGMNAGGLVYSEHGVLRFHPWMPEEAAAAADRSSAESQEIYARLLPKYFFAELEGLLEEMARPRTRRGLGRLGISPHAVEELRRQAGDDPPPGVRQLLRRRAANLIRQVMPSGADRHHLALADKLRFYSGEAPGGRYVGLYEVRGPGWLVPDGPDPLPSAGRRLTITKELEGAILVEDLSPAGRRVYRLTPVPHPAGLPLYRLGRRV